MDDEEKTAALSSLAECQWFNELCATGEATEYHRDGWTDAMRKHYVMGERAPFRYRMATATGTTTEECHLIWAVYCGEFSHNGAQTLQGGAISSLFDVGTANLGGIMLPQDKGAFGVTKTLTVNFISPGPVSEVLRLDIRNTDFDRIEQGRFAAQAELYVPSHAQNRLVARGEAEMVDPPRRQVWKEKNPRRSSL
jgi:acyl-coenzyme A thioesterase PaaI-like protein